MKKKVLVVLFLFISGFALTAHAGLDDFLKDINAKAVQDINHFNASVSKHFGIPIPDVEVILAAVINPADAFMCLQLSLMTDKAPGIVMETYRKKGGAGWGNIAKELGIKPGSAEFHALKRGDFGFYYNSVPEERKEKEKNSGKGKSKSKKIK